jgi:hypothetical protein
LRCTLAAAIRRLSGPDGPPEHPAATPAITNVAAGMRLENFIVVSL